MSGISTRVKELWFDRQAVTQAVDRACRQKLARFGYLVMRDARESIRKRKAPSSPGQPPSSHTGLLRRFIFFSYDPARRAVLIGPTKLGKSGDQPHALEFGRGRLVPRPYMRPAFARQLERNMPGIWRNCMGR